MKKDRSKESSIDTWAAGDLFFNWTLQMIVIAVGLSLCIGDDGHFKIVDWSRDVTG